jgi:hypothetical protein
VEALVLRNCRFFSARDEAHFFGWLESIPGVVRVVGGPSGLVITLRSTRLSEVALRELLALHARYGLPMRQLARFETLRNKTWFRSKQAYWYARVFAK